MSEIEKLSNVKFVITDEVLNRKWGEVIAKRNNLLSASDWTQLVDTDLAQSVRNVWIQWRKKVREVSRSTINNPDKAMNLLKSLEKQSPKGLDISSVANETYSKSSTPTQVVVDSEQVMGINDYVDKIFNDTIIPKLLTPQDVQTIFKEESSKTTIQILEHFQSILDKRLNIHKRGVSLSTNIEESKVEAKRFINKSCDEMLPFHNQILFEEALDYAVDSSTKVVMLEVYSKYYNKSLEETAQYVLTLKKEFYKESCIIEEKRLNYFSKVDNSTTIDELEEILNEFINGH